MQREILISATSQESWVALMEDNQLVEIMLDRPDQGRLVGDIYLGKVEAVLPGIQASFVDIGTDKAGFLHASDLVPENEDDDEQGGGGRRNRKLVPIQDHVQKGQELLVQVTKEAIGTKGPRLTTQISLAGRFLVFMPFSSHVGISRRIDNRGERARLRKLAKEVLPKDSGGIIVRTVGEELNKNTFQKEFKRLHSTWKKIQQQAEAKEAPALVRAEAKLISGVIRDLFSDKFDALIVDNKAIHNEILQYLKNVDPDLKSRVQFHDESVPLFEKHNVDVEIQRAFRREVELPSGGYIVIEPTEALVSNDVKTGKFTGNKKKDPVHTILKTNPDAAREIANQLRLRDIGGIVVCDYIDMESQENRTRVLHELKSHLGRDRARTRAFEVSELGLIEMTRQRVRPSLLQSLTEECGHCGGAGLVYTAPTVVRRVERTLERVASAGTERLLVVRVHPEIALEILESEHGFRQRMERKTKLKIEIRDDPLLRQDEVRLMSGPAETDVTAMYHSG